MIDLRPAHTSDVSAVMGTAGRKAAATMKTQVATYPCWLASRNHRPVALFGMAPTSDQVNEVWFRLAHDASKADKLAVLPEILRRLAVVMPEDYLICRILDGNRAGQRMAAMAGFMPTSMHMEGTRIRTWFRTPVSEKRNADGEAVSCSQRNPATER